jgi:transcriptional regulator with PAS, ATPase and Fis domain
MLPDNHNKNVSRAHLRFSRPGGHLHIEDLHSRCGTFIDGIQLEPGKREQIRDGAILRLGNTLLVYREDLEEPHRPLSLLGGLVAPWSLREVRKSLQRLKRGPRLNVLIEGPTGAGKESLAQEVARVLGRKNRFTTVNVAAIPEELFEGHLFGWKKGAFTSSTESNKGVFQDYDGGAVFLDEIEALPLKLQPKLLRFLQQREILTVGSSHGSTVDVVLIAATNRSMRDMLQESSYRQDFYERFQVRLELSPLKHRPEDVYAIFEAVWKVKYDAPLALKGTREEVAAVELMMRYSWPGNVRELERLVDSFDPAKGIELGVVRKAIQVEETSASSSKQLPLTREVIQQALDRCKGNQAQAARLLDIHRQKLRRQLEKYNLK